MVDELIEKISDESGTDADDIRERIQDKVEELSGLVSEEGAAHLIAREEGVELSEAEEAELTVDNVVPGMNRVDLKCKVVDISDINTFERDGDEEDGKVRNIVLGDSTGTLRLTLWDDQVEVGEKMDEGDSIHITGAYSREDNRGNVELRVGDSTQIGMLDEDIGEVKETTGGGGAAEAERATVPEVMNENMNYTVHGTVLEIYADSPFYKACPECRKKVEDEDGDWVCGEHGTVEPDDTLILSAIVDDGYGNIRTVYFRDRAKELLDATDVEFDGDAELVQEHAERVKGRDVLVTGRARYNDFFNSMELIVNDLTVPDPGDRLDELLDTVEA